MAAVFVCLSAGHFFRLSTGVDSRELTTLRSPFLPILSMLASEHLVRVTTQQCSSLHRFVVSDNGHMCLLHVGTSECDHTPSSLSGHVCVGNICGFPWSMPLPHGPCRALSSVLEATGIKATSASLSESRRLHALNLNWAHRAATGIRRGIGP